MRLNTMAIRSFKGVREFTLDARGHDVDIYAANGVGKTSIADAFSWLLFGLDSLGRADFGIIPTDDNGLVIEGASPTVAAELEFPDGETITLQRRLIQKSLSVRGAAPTAAGTKTDFAIDGVPVKKAELQRRIAEAAGDQLFPLLIDPHAFCGSLHWQKRRELLLRLFGLNTDADVIAGEPDLAELPAILGKRNIDEHRRMLAPKLADLKKQLATIPARIDEVKRGIPPTGDRGGLVELTANADWLWVMAQMEHMTDGGAVDDLRRRFSEAEAKRLDAERRIKTYQTPPYSDPAADLATLRAGRRFTHANLERIANGGESADLRRQLAEVKARIVDSETATKRANAERLAGLVAARQAARELLAERGHLLSGVQRRIDSAEAEVSRIKAEAEKLATFSEGIANRQPPEVGFDDACPSCGQQLPAEQLRRAADRAMAEHNRTRSEAIENAIEMGARLARQLDNANRGLEKLSVQAGEVRISIDDATQALNAAESAVQGFIPTEPENHALSDEAETIMAKIAELDSGNAEALATTQAALDQIDAQIAAAESAMADARAREQAEGRIAALTAERRALASQLDTVEGELALCALFTRRKIEQTTHAINSRFGGLTWKLFDQQVNGEIADCCEATVNGVPWRDLSNSQKINAGLSVIDVIGQQCGITPPIFIDNAESVSAIRPTTAQQIRLIVSAAHKQLTVEVAK